MSGGEVVKVSRPDSEIVFLGVIPSMEMTIFPPEGTKIIQTEKLLDGMVIAEIIRRDDESIEDRPKH